MPPKKGDGHRRSSSNGRATPKGGKKKKAGGKNTPKAVELGDVELTAAVDARLAEASTPALSKLAGHHYAIDSGMETFKYLSYEKVSAEKHLWHPRQPKRPGEKLPRRFHPCGATTGRHALCYSASGAVGDFAPFGVGITLYFKYLKFVGSLMFIFSILGFPSLVFYVFGGKSDALAGVGGIASLSVATIGNLGDSQVMCETLQDGEHLHLECPEGAVLGRIEAYYGQVEQGSCECPAADTPLPLCPGTRDGSTAACLQGVPCHLDTTASVLFPSGTSYDVGSCCSDATAASGKADFSHLDFVINETCTSSSAQRIVEGICAGQQLCDFEVTRNTNLTWYPQRRYETWCVGGSGSEGEEDTTELAAKGTEAANPNNPDSFLQCSEAFASYSSDFDTCTTNHFELVVNAKCFDTTITAFGQVVNKDDAALMVMALDFLICVLFFAGWLRLRQREAEATEIQDRKMITAGDYALQIRNLPDDYPDINALSKALTKHLCDVLGKAEPVTSDKTKTITIADIQFGLKNAAVLQGRLKRAAVYHKLEMLEKSAFFFQYRQNVNAEGTVGDSFVPKDLAALDKDEDLTRFPQIRRILKKKHKLERKVEKIQARIVKSAKAPKLKHPIVAYVTMNTEEGYLRALDTYPATMWSRTCQSRDKKMKTKAGGLQRVVLDPASEPTDIFWENLEPSEFNRSVRSFITFVVSTAIIIGSAYLLFLSEDSKRTNSRRFPPAQCANFADSVSNKSLVELDVLWQENNQTKGNTGRLECYCKDILSTVTTDIVNRFTQESFEEFYPGTTSNLWCVEWLKSFSINQALTYSAALGVLVINLLLRSVLKQLVAFERHRSKTEELVSRMTKLFLVQVINTGFVILLVNARIESGVDIELLRNGEFSDFTSGWYSTVGTSILLTMTLNILVPHMTPAFQTLFVKCKRCRDRGCSKDIHRTKKLTQADLEKLYTGPAFLLAERYAQSLTAIFVCFAYATGIPLLYLVCMLTLASFYWVDKYMFCRIYRLPPNLNDRLAVRVTNLLPIALILHAGFGMWMLSNNEIFQPTEEIVVSASIGNAAADNAVAGVASSVEAVSQTLQNYDVLSSSNFDASRVMIPQAVPLFIVFLLVVLYNFLQYTILKRIRAILSTICRCRCCIPKASPEGFPPYFRALTDGMLTRSLNQPWVQGRIRQRYRDELAYRVYWRTKNALYEDMLEREVQKLKELDPPRYHAEKKRAEDDSLRAVKVFLFLTDDKRSEYVPPAVAVERAMADVGLTPTGQILYIDEDGEEADAGADETKDADLGADGAVDDAGFSDDDESEYESSDGGEDEEDEVEAEKRKKAKRLRNEKLLDKYDLRTRYNPQQMMVGLHTYDMRQNPDYLSRFALDSKFLDPDAEKQIDEAMQVEKVAKRKKMSRKRTKVGKAMRRSKRPGSTKGGKAAGEYH